MNKLRQRSDSRNKERVSVADNSHLFANINESNSSTDVVELADAPVTEVLFCVAPSSGVGIEL